MAGRMVGIGGPHASGKETAARYLMERHGYTKLVDVSGILRAGARDIGKARDLPSLLDAYRELKCGYFFRRISEQVVGYGEKTIVSSLRDADLHHLLQQKYDLFLIMLSVRPEIAFERMQARERVGDLADFGRFLEQEKSEAVAYRMYELYGRGYEIDNNGSEEALRAQLDDAMRLVL